MNSIALSSLVQVLLITLAALLAQALGGGSAAPDIVLSTGHGANISALAFSPDGKYLVSASEDATLKLWNPETGGEIRTLRGHSNIVTSIALSADGTQIASASLDHTLRVWNAATGESVAVIRGPQPTVYLLKMTPDAASLITAETVAAGTILRFWDIKTGKQTRMIKRDDAAVSHLFFSGKTMFVAEESGEDDATGALTTYDWQTGKQLQTRKEVLCGVSENGKWLAIDRSTASTRKAMIVDLAKDKPYATLSGQVSRVMFSNNGEWLAYESSAGDTAVVRKTAGASSQTIHGRGAEFSMMALSPDGKWLATAGADYSLHIWDVDSGKLAHGVSGQYTPSVVAFSADGRRVAVNGGGTDLGSALQLWDIDRKAQITLPRIKRSIVGLAFGKNADYLAVSTSSVAVFDVRSGGLVTEVSCASGSALSPVFSPSGRFLAANCGGVITLWSVVGGSEIFHFGSASEANSGPVVFSADAKYLAASSSTGVTIYDIQGRKVMQSLATADPVTALAFSPTGDTLAFGIRLRAPKPDLLVPTLFMFDMKARRKSQSIFAGQWVSSLKFERDGRSLLAATGDDLHKSGSLMLYETATGKPLRRLNVRVPSSSTPAISPNGEWIGLGWNSGTSLWRLSAH